MELVWGKCYSRRISGHDYLIHNQKNLLDSTDKNTLLKFKELKSIQRDASDSRREKEKILG